MHVTRSEGKPGEARLRCFGHVQRRHIEYTTRRLELPGRRRPSVKPKRRFIDAVKEDMKLVSVREEDAEYRVGWRHLIGCGDRREKKTNVKKMSCADKNIPVMMAQAYYVSPVQQAPAVISV